MGRKRYMAWFKTWEMYTFIRHACREEADGWPTRIQKDVKRNLKGIDGECGLDSTWHHIICSLNIKHRYWHTCLLNTGQTSVMGYRYLFYRKVELKVWRILTRKLRERSKVFWQTPLVYLIDTWMTSRETAEMFDSHRRHFHQPVEHWTGKHWRCQLIPINYTTLVTSIQYRVCLK